MLGFTGREWLQALVGGVALAFLGWVALVVFLVAFGG